MTITNQKRFIRYQGNGATTVFPYDFLIPDANSVVVSIYDSVTETTTELTPGQYNITGLGDVNFGDVTYPTAGAPLPSTQYIIITREVAYTQDLLIENQGGFFADTVMAQLDRIVMQTQQLAEVQTRTIKTGEGNTFPNLPDKSALANQVLTFDANGNPTPADALGVGFVAMGTIGKKVLASETQREARNALVVPPYLRFLSEIKALSPNWETFVFWRDPLRGGTFQWVAGDFTAEIAEDVNNGVYIKADSMAASVGAWVRVFEGGIKPQWFGADPTGAADSTAAINAATSFMRNLGVKTTSVLGRRYYVDGAGGMFRVNGSINLTQFTLGRNWGMRNIVLDAHCTGKVVLDLTGSRFGDFENIHIWGDQTDTPYSGIQVCVEDNGGGGVNPADNNYFRNVSVDGYFRQTAIYNHAGEVCNWDCVRGWNRRVADGAGPSFALIMDGYGHQLPISDFTTPHSGGRISFTVNNFTHCQFLKPFGIAGPTTFFQDVASLMMLNTYMTNGSGAIIEWRLTSFVPYRITLDVQVETTGVDRFILFTSDAAASRQLIDLDITFGNCFIDTEMFKTDTLTALRIDRFKLRIPRWASGSAPVNGIFNDKTIVSLYDADVSIPAYSEMGDPSTFAAFGGKITDTAGVHRDYRPASLFVSRPAPNLHTRLECKDDGATIGPALQLDRLSATPADNDEIGELQFTGRSNAAVQRFYAFIRARMVSVADALEQGRLTFWVRNNGGPVETLRIDNNGFSMYGANVVVDQNRVHHQRSYTVGTLPSASPAGQTVYVSDESGGAVLAFSDGTNWRRSTDRAIVS